MPEKWPSSFTKTFNLGARKLFVEHFITGVLKPTGFRVSEQAKPSQSEERSPRIRLFPKLPRAARRPVSRKVIVRFYYVTQRAQKRIQFFQYVREGFRAVLQCF